MSKYTDFRKGRSLNNYVTPVLKFREHAAAGPGRKNIFQRNTRHRRTHCLYRLEGYDTNGDDRQINDTHHCSARSLAHRINGGKNL